MGRGRLLVYADPYDVMDIVDHLVQDFSGQSRNGAALSTLRAQDLPGIRRVIHKIRP